MAKLIGVPQGAKVWRVNVANKKGKKAKYEYYLVYYTPSGFSGSSKRTPIAYRIPPREWQRIFGTKSKKGKVDKKLWLSSAKKAGMFDAGVSHELKDLGKHPFSGFVHDYNRAAKLRPWMRRREMIALAAEAWLEGREIRDSDLKQSDWWKNSNPEQRAWMELVNTDPKAAERRKEDNRLRVAKALEQAGMTKAPAALVNYWSDKFTTGSITEADLQHRIEVGSDPYMKGASVLAGLTKASLPSKFAAVKYKNKMYLRTAHGDFELVGDGSQARFGGIKAATSVSSIKRKGANAELAEYLNTFGYGVIIPGQEEVKALADEYLGKYKTEPMNASWFGNWASLINRDESAKDKYMAELQKMADAEWGEQYGPGAKWSDIAPQWRNLFNEIWGTSPAEDDPFFNEIVRNNDVNYAQRRIREEGIRQGNVNTINKFQNDISQAFGGGVVGVL